jgi:hypothetical protein
VQRASHQHIAGRNIAVHNAMFFQKHERRHNLRENTGEVPCLDILLAYTQAGPTRSVAAKVTTKRLAGQPRTVLTNEASKT